MRLLHFRNVMIQVIAKRLPVELQELVPVRIARLARHVLDAGGLAKRLHGRVAVVRHRGPALAIHPDAVHAVVAGQFAQLRDEQLVGIRSERTTWSGH